MLPFTRETPARIWLGFVNEADGAPSSVLITRVLPVLAMAGVALLVLSGGEHEHEPEGPPPSSAAAARMRVAAAGVAVPRPATSTAVDAPTGLPATTEKPEAASLTPASTELEARALLVDPPPSAAASQEPPPPKTTQPRREPKPPKPLSPAAARRANKAARELRSALAGGRVLQSRENFAVSMDGGEDTWAEAKASCAGLEVDGVAGWRLPSRGEAREVHRGRASGSKAYWTRQRGPHGDTIYVYDPRTGRSSPWLDVEVAHIVCVQPKPR